MVVDSSRLIRARKAAALSQGELAKRAGIDQSQISRVERTGKGISWQALVSICTALGVDPTTMLPATATVSRGARARILEDNDAPEGLKSLAANEQFAAAIGVTEPEWEALRSLKLPSPTDHDGYAHILMAIRAVCGTVTKT